MDQLAYFKQQYPLQFGEKNTILRTMSKEVKKNSPEIKELAEALEMLLWEYEWVGIAAPQIGHNVRMSAITQRDTSQKERELLEEVVLINPVIIGTWEETDIQEEGCLSLPNQAGRVERFLDVTIKYQTIDGKEHVRKASGYNARIIQHEIDHLDGVLFLDKLV